MKKWLLLLNLIMLPSVAMTQREQEQMFQYSADMCLQEPMRCVEISYQYNIDLMAQAGELEPYATPKNEELKRKIYRECYRFYMIQYYNDWKNGNYSFIPPYRMYVR